MANNVIKRKWNMNSMVQIEDLTGMTFQDEAAGHTFEISAIDDAGNAVALSGTPAGVFLRPDNTDQALTCSVSNGKVYATLPAGCYDIPGRFGLTIFLTSNSQTAAIYAAVGTVARTSSGTASPGTTQDVVDLINAINAAIAQIPASDTNLKAAMAPTYSTSALYAVGDYAWYNGVLYKCTTAITSGETWTSSHWTAANMGGDVSALKSAFGTEYNRSNGFDTGLTKKEYNLVQLNDAQTIHDWVAGAINPVITGDTISFGSQSNIRHFYTDAQEGDIFKVKIRKPNYTNNTSCVVFTDDNGVVVLPLEVTTGIMTVIENMFVAPAGATRMYLMTQDTGGTNTGLTNLFKATNSKISQTVDALAKRFDDDDKRSNMFDSSIAKGEYDLYQITAVNNWANGAIAPVSIGDTISFESQASIKHFDLDVVAGEIYKIALKKPGSIGNSCVVFTDSDGVVVLPLEKTSGALTNIENMFVVPTGATKMYMMSQDTGGTNTDSTNIYKAILSTFEKNNLASSTILKGYWNDKNINSRSGSGSALYASISQVLDAGEYTISFGVKTDIIRTCINGGYSEQTIVIPEGGCFSFRCFESGNTGFSFIRNDSQNWDSWVQIEKTGNTIGKIQKTAVDVELRKSVLFENQVIKDITIRQKDLLNGYWDNGVYKKSSNRLTTFNFVKINKGDIAILNNDEIIVAFMYFDSDGEYVDATSYISNGYYSTGAINSKIYRFTKDGYVSFNLFNRIAGNSASIDRSDYDNIITIINSSAAMRYSDYMNRMIYRNMRAKQCNVSINGQGGCIIGNKLYSFEGAGNSGGAINIINLETMQNDGVGSHTLGHANSVDYNETTDTLITYGTNGTNQPTIVLYTDPDFSQTLQLTDQNCIVIPLYNESGHMNTSACICFGEAPNIAYYMEGIYSSEPSTVNPVRNIYKILLGMGSNDLSSEGYGTFISGKTSSEYNGTCKILKTYTGEIIPGIQCYTSGNSLWTVQDMKFNGYLIVGYGTNGNNNLKIALNDYWNTYSVIENYHFEMINTDGSTVALEPELVALYKGKMYCGASHHIIEGGVVIHTDNYLFELDLT